MFKNLLVILALFASVHAYAQPYKTIKIYKPYKWMLGLHVSAIEDDGEKFKQVFKVQDRWNIQPFPTRLTLDRYFLYGWSAEAALTYTQYKSNIIVNDSTGITGAHFSFDLNGKYSFYQLYAPRARWIEPYLTFGIGYTYRDKTAEMHVPTLNLGGGLNWWFSKFVGLQISSSAKFALYPEFWDTKSNYLQHNIGLVFRTAGENAVMHQDKRKHHKWSSKHSTKKFRKKHGH